MEKSRKNAEIKSVINSMLQKRANSLSHQDLKLVNYSLTAIPVGFTSFSYDSGIGYMYPDVGIVNGASLEQRIGNEIRMRKFEWNLAIAPGDDYNTCRFLVLRTKGTTQAIGATLAQQVFSNGTGAQSISRQVDPFLFDVLHDEYFVVYKRPLNGSSATTVDLPTMLSGHVNLNNQIRYGQSGTATSGGRLLVILASDSVAIPNPGCVGGAMRLTFTDV